ncbi:hypothetical protein Y032_0015g2604 [Ancylostoma ceylanicum]|uniref:Phospholipase A2 n=2 Tax=Ancylostoma ceylanicum TaxID=53326 RepID=A0A016V6P8_9BILA|nr:hypothetical protein Y032_0015g2604 [Ancylostoma ceylanicum]
MSYESMNADKKCWKHAVNHCCAVHDDCYGVQMGRDLCDDNFCSCLKNATEPDGCGVTDMKCFLVQLFGQKAYDDSASFVGSLEFPMIFPTINGTNREFQTIYEQCPQVKLTIKSCCLIANLCLEKGNLSECSVELDGCVQQAASMQNTEKCHLAAERIHKLLGR